VYIILLIILLITSGLRNFMRDVTVEIALNEMYYLNSIASVYKVTALSADMKPREKLKSSF